MTLEPKDMPLIITNRMDTVYLALGVFRWKTPSELRTEQNYAPPYIDITVSEVTICASKVGIW